MKQNSIILYILIILSIFLFLSACSQNENVPTMNNDIYISSATTSLGVDSDDSSNTDTHVLSYEFSLCNETNQKVFVNSAEPIFQTDFEKLVISKENKIEINKELNPKSTIIIKGNKINFNAKSLTKEQINEISPYITDIKINYNQVLGFAKKSE